MHVQNAVPWPCWSNAINIMLSSKLAPLLTSSFHCSLFHPSHLCLPFSPLHTRWLFLLSSPVPRPCRPCSSWWLPSRCLSTFEATRRFPTSIGMKRRQQLYWRPGRGDTLRYENKLLREQAGKYPARKGDFGRGEGKTFSLNPPPPRYKSPTGYRWTWKGPTRSLLDIRGVVGAW